MTENQEDVSLDRARSLLTQAVEVLTRYLDGAEHPDLDETRALIDALREFSSPGAERDEVDHDELRAA